MRGRMTVYEAAEDQRALLEALGRSAELEIDLSEVTELDTAGIQILALAKREAARAGKTVRLTAHSPATLEAIDCYGLGGFFGDPLVISSRKR
jgi:anti-anti-sigma regulatory factor